MTTLGEVCLAIVDCEHKTAPKSSKGYPSIRTTDIKNGRIDFENANRVSQETYFEWTRRRRPQAGDLILAREAPVGEVGYIPEGIFPVMGQRTVLLSPDRSQVEPRYLHYLLLSSQMQHAMKVRSGGSTVNHLNMTDIRFLELPTLPSLSEQCQIAATLGALDDKIDVNHRTSKLLESMAQVIFKDWFVDFGPVYAKMEGREPYLNRELWNLFPNNFSQDEMPSGWRSYKLTDIATQYRRTINPSHLSDEQVELYSIPSFDRSEIPDCVKISEIKSNKILIPENAVLVSKLNPQIPRVWIPSPQKDKLRVASTEFLTFQPNGEAYRNVLFSLFKSADFQRIMQSLVTGTSKSHQRVSVKSLLETEVISGNQLVFQAFAKIVDPMIEKIQLNRSENQSLAQMRDLLLPKLMSGEVRVREAEKMVGEAV